MWYFALAHFGPHENMKEKITKLCACYCIGCFVCLYPLGIKSFDPPLGSSAVQQGTPRRAIFFYMALAWPVSHKKKEGPHPTTYLPDYV